MTTNILLIDLSSIAHREFHTSANDPDQNATATKTVAKVRAFASGRRSGVAIAMDGPPYFRKDIDPAYKAQRDKENNAVVGHQIATAADTLRADGFPVWQAKGFEADDIVASATAWAMRGTSGETVTIASADKDLEQLVSERVTIHKPDGGLCDASTVLAKRGVDPRQMVDYLALVGDASDNIKGCNGIGEKKAAALLAKYGTLEDVFADLDTHGTNFTPATATALREFQGRMETVRSLIRLRTDVLVPFEEVFKERVAQDVAAFGGSNDGTQDMDGFAESSDGIAVDGSTDNNARNRVSATSTGVGDGGTRRMDEGAGIDSNNARTAGGSPTGFPAANRRTEHQAASTVHHGEAVTPIDPMRELAKAAEVVNSGAPPRQVETQALAARPAPLADFDIASGPQTYAQAKLMAADLFAAKLFSGYGSPAAVLSTIIIGKELGLTVGGSLRGFHIVESKHLMHADLIRARAEASPDCEYFYCSERTDTAATFVTKNKKHPKETTLRFSIEDGQRAWPRKEKDGSYEKQSFNASGWGKNPADMCVARASSKLARLVYPSAVHGFYAPEEMD